MDAVFGSRLNPRCEIPPPPARAQDDRPVVIARDAPKETVAANPLPTLRIAGDSTLRSNAPLRG